VTQFWAFSPYHGPAWVDNPLSGAKNFITDFANRRKTRLSFCWTLRLWYLYGFRRGKFLPANDISCPTSTATSLRTGRPLCNVPPEIEGFRSVLINFSGIFSPTG